MDLDKIKVRIQQLSDEELKKECLEHISEYKDEIQALYKNELSKRGISAELEANGNAEIEKNNPSVSDNSIIINEKIPAISDEEILKLFFEKNNISEYMPKFIEQKVFSPELLKELTDTDLEKLGFPLLGDRKKLIKLFSGDEFNNFKNEILFKDLSPEERLKLDIPENKILKQNYFQYGGSSVFSEEGQLTLYQNRIVWKGSVNRFIIPINKIIDVSVKNGAGHAILKIKDDIKQHDFYMVDNKTLGLAGAAMYSGNLSLIGLAIMNDKPMSDIEYWRVLIEKLREKNISFNGDRGEIKSNKSNYKPLIIFIIIGIIIYIAVVFHFSK